MKKFELAVINERREKPSEGYKTNVIIITSNQKRNTFLKAVKKTILSALPYTEGRLGYEFLVDGALEVYDGKRRYYSSPVCDKNGRTFGVKIIED